MNFYTHIPAIDRLLPIGELLRDPTVQEVFINSGGRVCVDRGGSAMEGTAITVPDTSLHAVIGLLMAADGGYLDPEAPFATLTLSCGRFHGALKPAASETQISIRTDRRIARPLTDFMSENLIERPQRGRLKKSVVIGGGTSAGMPLSEARKVDLGCSGKNHRFSRWIVGFSAVKPSGDFSNVTALEARDFKLVLRGLPRAVTVRQG